MLTSSSLFALGNVSSYEGSFAYIDSETGEKNTLVITCIDGRNSCTKLSIQGLFGPDDDSIMYTSGEFTTDLGLRVRAISSLISENGISTLLISLVPAINDDEIGRDDVLIPTFALRLLNRNSLQVQVAWPDYDSDEGLSVQIGTTNWKREK